MSYGKYRAAVISVCDYDSEGVGYSSVQEDFPFAIGPDVFYDTISNIRKPWGRHPVTNEPLLVTEVDRYTSTIDTHGVVSSSAYAVPAQGSTPDVCIVIVQVSNTATLVDIEGAAKHFVLGIDDPDLYGAPLPAGLLPYEFDAPIPAGRWTTLRDGMVSRGMGATALDNWKTNNPDATPRDFGKAFKNFIS